MNRRLLLSVEEQLRSGKLVCPETHLPLEVRSGRLATADGRRSYPLAGGVPVLLADAERVEKELGRQGAAMVAEYAAGRPPGLLRRLHTSTVARVGDQRTRESERAFAAIFLELPPDALCLSVGGGPTRADPRLVNLNLAAFPNVEVVADAYALPYADGAVDALHCEAVLEHLEYPEAAVAEMFRVLAPGRELFAATPFLQAFHGYPDHYQNFTLTGHRRLFERAGFTVVAAGHGVGPVFMLSDLLANALRHALPGGASGKAAARAAELLLLPALYLDRWTARRPGASNVASTTYVRCVKPGALPTQSV